MQNRKVCVLCNLKPATMRGIKSQAMVLAVSNDDHSKVSRKITSIIGFICSHSFLLFWLVGLVTRRGEDNLPIQGIDPWVELWEQACYPQRQPFDSHVLSLYVEIIVYDVTA